MSLHVYREEDRFQETPRRAADTPLIATINAAGEDNNNNNNNNYYAYMIMMEESSEKEVQNHQNHHQKQTKFEQHNDPDVIIPDRISLSLVMSAQLLLVNAIVAHVYDLSVLSTLLLFVWLTSILHWRQPRFSSYRRVIDYAAVAALIGYSTYFSITVLSTMFMVVWFVGLGCIAIMFTANETAYYLQIGTTPLGGDEESNRAGTSLRSSATRFPYAAPNTEARDWVFKRTACAHLFAVHVVANALALTIILGSQSSQ